MSERVEAGTDLDGMRGTFAQRLVFFVWFNVLLVIGAAWWAGTLSVTAVSGSALLLGSAATAIWIRAGVRIESRIATAISLAFLAALFVAVMASTGSAAALPLDAQVYFFVVLAVLAGWLDWRSLAAYAGVVAALSIMSSVALPWAALPGGPNLPSAVFLAGALALEAVALWWIVAQLVLMAAGAAAGREQAVRSQIQHAEVPQESRPERLESKGVNDPHAVKRIAEFRQEILAKLEAVTGQAQSMRAASAELAATVEGTSEKAGSAVNSAGAASSNIQTVASAAEELASSIGEISRQVDQTSSIVAKAALGAQASNQKVAGLEEAANRIGEVVSMIQAIAGQTNLLALNATIEAARAGEAGKGFAVVASEVKALATQTSKATEEIAAQVAAIQSETKEAVDAIGAIAATMDEINTYTSTIAAAVEQQGSATDEISRNVTEAAEGSGLVAATIGGLTEASAKAAVSANAVSQGAEALEHHARDVRAVVDGFLLDVAV
ncbi:methyl-accepting chemotaxis protein [Roseibium litorale]|uniref:Chemotaxis protein n=1 Tax=Roseibium litorale TaxID=2803841 RepID=A0ABR9CH70_9HYPH|nr:methyl-accepting chemotaxis protein [Roseibium litorale]MBD8890198.1 chemotaxis protein [Roseibium litorale]